jgi:hypothetical protein
VLSALDLIPALCSLLYNSCSLLTMPFHLQLVSPRMSAPDPPILVYAVGQASMGSVGGPLEGHPPILVYAVGQDFFVWSVAGLYVFPSILLSVLCLPVYMSVCQAVCLSFSLSICQSICLFIFLSIHLPVDVCLYLPVYLSVCIICLCISTPLRVQG